MADRHRPSKPTPAWESDPADNWHQHAACRSHDPEIWFPTGHGQGAQADAEYATAICRACPVAGPCAYWALDLGSADGIWGGLDEDDRRRINRERAAAAPPARVASKPPPPVRTSGPAQPCGTKAAHDRHIAHHEQPCDPCIEAYRAYQDAYNERKRLRRAAAREAVQRRAVLTGSA